MNRKKIYIASPYTIGDVAVNVKRQIGDIAVNVKRQIDAANELIALGDAPYTPLLSHFHHLIHPNHYDTWMDVGLTWLVECDAVLRLPGESKGADIECGAAHVHGIPIYYSIREIIGML